jgi:hypothetical protein
MAAKEPFTFTAVSYITDQSGSGKTVCREKIIFEQILSPEDNCQFKPVRRTVYMSEEEQTKCDKKMMKHVEANLAQKRL